MKKTRLKDKLNQYIDAGFPILYINSFEDDKVDDIIREIGDRKEIIEWNGARGMVNFTTKAPQLISAGGLSETLNLFLEKDELDRKILVLKDMHTQLENPEVVAKLKIIANLINQGIDGTVIIVSPVITIPPELENLKDEFNLDIDEIELVKLGQKTENDFVGLNSGIMDQFAVGMGKENNAIYLDCNTLEYKYLPLELGDYEIIIMSTNKNHSLAGSKYNERVQECEEAVKRLNKKLDINKLGELDSDTFDQYTSLIDDDTLIRRARHAVSENERTKKAIDAMEKGDLEELGRLINASHVSLKYDYEVTGKELDTLAENAWDQPGCLGARMVGGGFAGSAIAIVKKSEAENFKKNVGKIYRDKIGYDASFYDAEVVDGPHKL